MFNPVFNMFVICYFQFESIVGVNTNHVNRKKVDRFHRESRDGVDAVLTRMCRAINAIPDTGYAEALDVSSNTVKTWRRRGEVSMKYLTGFAKENGLSLDYLRYGSEVRNEPLPVNTKDHCISEAGVYQAVLDAVDLLSLEKKVDALQLAKAVVKLCNAAQRVLPGGDPPKSRRGQTIIYGKVGQSMGDNHAPMTINMDNREK